MDKLLSSDAERYDFAESLKSYQEFSPKVLRLNPLRGEADFIKTLFLSLPGIQIKENLSWCKRAFRVDKTNQNPKGLFPSLGQDPYIGAGLAYLQEPGATEAVEMLDPQPGDWVLDLCAAPGGKATQVGEKLGGQGYLVANDPVRPRAERLSGIVARHGILNASISAMAPENMSDNFAGLFDKVLVDAPCSGESLFAKRKELRADIRDADVAGCARRQFLILSHAARLVRGSGFLLYSTCTYSREENEDIVDSFVSENPDWEIIKTQRRWPHIDQVAGGFCALLKNNLPDENIHLERDRKNMIEQTDGFLRHGALSWNGEKDFYAEILAASVFKTDLSLFESLEVDRAGALRFLNGEALPQTQSSDKKWARIVFENFSLGPAKNAKDRWNNLIPKALRSS